MLLKVKKFFQKIFYKIFFYKNYEVGGTPLYSSPPGIGGEN